MEHRSLGALLPRVSYWLEMETVKAQDTKQPLGPFVSNSDNLSATPWLPPSSLFMVQMSPELSIPKPNLTTSLSLVFLHVSFLKTYHHG